MRDSSKGRGYSRFYTGVYACGVVVLALLATSVGLSHFFSMLSVSRGSQKALELSMLFDAANPTAYMKRGNIDLSKGRFADAVNNYEQAVLLRENDFVLWLRLGVARGQIGDLAGAQQAYERSVRLAPNYSPPNWFLGLLLLETGQNIEEAFSHMRVAARQDWALYSQLLEFARVRFPNDAAAIENLARPQTPEQTKAMISVLIANGLISDSVRTYLTGTELNGSEKDQFISQLIANKQPGLAFEIWSSKGGKSPTDPGVIYDGGFESVAQTDDEGFGWRFDRKVPGVTVALDSKSVYTGSRSFQINFSGNVEAGRKFISQLVLVRPKQNYRLIFVATSTELLSGGLPVIVISSGLSDVPIARSSLIEPTDGNWKAFKVDFTTGDEETILISLQRANCSTSPCPIFGSLWLDDFSLAQAH